MRKSLRDVVVKVYEVARPRTGDIVVDVGCNDGTLLRSYEIPGLRLVGFEPARNLVESARKGTELILNSFFNYNTFRRNFPGLKARVITSIAMFYDVDNPHRFVEDISRCLHPDGVWVVQQNYLPLMLTRNGFDNIGHEHLTYYSLETMTRLIQTHGLEVFDTETNEVNGGSFRTYIAHQGARKVRTSVAKMTTTEQRLFSRSPSIYQVFATNVKKVGAELHDFVARQARVGKKVYAYGASTRGNTILQYCHLDHRLITKACDANPEKWGLKTPGTNIPIVSKEEARADHPDYFLILPHHFLDEIRNEERGYLSAGGKLIVPLPRFLTITNQTKR